MTREQAMPINDPDVIPGETVAFHKHPFVDKPRPAATRWQTVPCRWNKATMGKQIYKAHA